MVRAVGQVERRVGQVERRAGSWRGGWGGWRGQWGRLSGSERSVPARIRLVGLVCDLREFAAVWMTNLRRLKTN